jgi:glycosyltransferase involved in cell wall biosynthesis
MKIGIDARFFRQAGPGRYTKSIVEHLEKIDQENEYFIFLRKEGMEYYHPKNKNFKKVLAEYPWYSFDEQTRFLAKILQQNLDLYYVPHFNIPIFYPKKIVTAIPDMTMHTYSTDKGTTLPLWYFKIKKLVYKFVFWWAVYRSYKVIVPTKSVLKDFLNHLSFPEEKYVLAYEGIDPDFLKKPNDPKKVLQKYGIKRNYLLSVGSMYEHKNVEGLIAMYKILKEKYGYRGQLVLASKRDKFSKAIYQRIKDESLEDDILVLAFKVPGEESGTIVSDEEIVALRLLADLYIMAAFKEGFSLTALEAMAVGLPAALSDIDCHREVYEDSVVYFDPYSAEDMARKVNQILVNDEMRNDYIERGYEQVAKYDWQRTAEITLKVFKEAFENRN